MNAAYRRSIQATMLSAGVFLSTWVAAQDRLSGPEIRKLVAGRSASWVASNGYKGSITYNPNGTLVARTRVLGSDRDLSGKWEIRGDRFCRSVSMELVRERCQTVQPVSASTYRFYNEDGSLATTTTFGR